VETLSSVDLQTSTAELGAETYLVTVSGELDVWSSQTFDDELAGAEERGARRLVVDLSSVPLIDSVVLGVLMRHAKKLRSSRGELVLISDDPRTLRVIDVTGLGFLFHMERTLAEALEHLAGSRNA
jgi:anti-sigma B factor antagonist